MQSDSQQTLSRTHEIENVRRQIAELTEQAEAASQEVENVKQRLTNQEKLVNEVLTTSTRLVFSLLKLALFSEEARSRNIWRGTPQAYY